MLEEGEGCRRAGPRLRRRARAARVRLARPRGRPAARHAGLPPPRAARRADRPRARESFSDLRTGDYVVHEDHGIGKLLGFETKEVAGVTRDYLLLAFRGDDRVFVPHEQIGKVSRYIGADAKAPTLSKLGGKAWDNLKARAREASARWRASCSSSTRSGSRRPGVAYDVEHEWVERLEAEFPFRETEDQPRAIEAVKEDLEAPHPMDRLVCGDVGFGKTEVAIRAAFAVAVNGKQVLMLVPTTILAQQHWNTFRERYRDFPVRVEMVSRFRSPAETKRVLADFGEGKVDVLIGTHRVLSRDVIPKELGLVVVDEEQRFGVAQKELLRQLRLEVDVLALSATPIPRTLHMSLSGLRDISVIETPPEGRRPIRTHVGEYDEELVATALERELAREGQAFYLHNRVETIEEAAEKLQQLCPELRVLVAHGQMRERELEDKMLAFLRGDADVLVSTTIIESGLDIPEANTLIVERADALGLAQLYQIRGRVGRSRVPAHAYLFYPDAGELTPEARARLATLADHTELGAGFAIAMRDLEIRGAGDLLGAEQSGHVAALGFELYVEMLHEAVAELSGQRRVAARPVRVDARVDAYVPAAYIASEALKIDLHRRLALVEDEDELRELEAATEDRYGPLPEPVENLFAIQEAKLKLAAARRRLPRLPRRPRAVGPVVLGSGELRELRGRVDTAVYSTAKREVSFRAMNSGGRLNWSMLCWPRARLLEALFLLCEGTPLPSSCSRRSRSAWPGAAATARRRRTGVAVVDDEQIRRREFDALISQAKRRTRQRSRPSRSRARPSTSRCRARRSGCSCWRSAQKAEELGIEVTDKQVDERLTRSRSRTSRGRKPSSRELKTQGLTGTRCAPPSSASSSRSSCTRRSPRTSRSPTTRSRSTTTSTGRLPRPRATCATSSSRTRRSPTSSQQLRTARTSPSSRRSTRGSGSKSTAAS